MKKISTSDQINIKWQNFYKRVASEAEVLLAKTASTNIPKPCNFCQSTSIQILFPKRGFQYAQCQNCGLVFIYPQLSQKFLEEVYNNTEIRQYYFQEILLDFGETHQVSFYTDRLQQIHSYFNQRVPEKGRLLDIGCAAGNFIMQAQKQGWKTIGLELNQTYVEYAQNERHLDVRGCTVEDLLKDNELFDVVTMWDVPEHLHNPVEFLRNASKLIKPGGILATTTINHNCINAKLFKQEWRYYHPPDHVYSFTPQLLSQILNTANLEVYKIIHYYFWEVFTEGLKLKGWGDVDIRFRISDRLEQLIEKKGFRVYIEKYSLRAIEIVLSAFVKSIIKLAETLKAGDVIEIYARKQE